MIRTIERAGYRCALGSIYPFDAQIPSPAFASAYILANVRPGAVIVLHDRRGRGRRTAETLQRVLPVLRARGYQVVSLSDLCRHEVKPTTLLHAMSTAAPQKEVEQDGQDDRADDAEQAARDLDANRNVS